MIFFNGVENEPQIGQFYCPPLKKTLRIYNFKSLEGLRKIGHLRCLVHSLAGYMLPEYVESYNNCYVDNLDPLAQHFVVMDETRLVASARLSFHSSFFTLPDYYEAKDKIIDAFSGPTASFTRLVVDPAYQRNGIATQLDAIRLEEAERHDIDSIFIMAVGMKRARAVEKLGFQCVDIIHESQDLTGTEIPCFVLRKTKQRHAELLDHLALQHCE